MTLITSKVFDGDAVLFDLDGVLIDSFSCITRHWAAWASRHGLDFDRVMQAAHGVRTAETMRQVAPHLDAAREAEHFTAHEVADTAGVVAIAGAAPLLASLPANRWAIVTSGGAELAQARLKAAGLPQPPILVTGDDVRLGKPDPEPYWVGAQRLGVAAKRCAVVEDAPAGVLAGKKAGMWVLGVASTHLPDELRESGADLIVEALTHFSVQAAPGGQSLVISIL